MGGSTTDPGDGLELFVIENDSDGTVTFSPQALEEVTMPATEWITVRNRDVVDVEQMQ